MKSRTSMRWLAWPALAAIVAVAALLASPADVTQAQPCGGSTPCNEIAAVGPGAAVAIGAEFDADADFTAADTPYKGYKAYLEWDDSVVNYVDPPGVTYTALGGMVLTAAPVTKDVNPINGAIDGVQFANGLSGTATSQELGTAANIRLVCVAPGTSALHLVTPGEDPSFGTKMLGAGGVAITTNLVDGSVVCEMQADLRVLKTHAPADPVTAGTDVTYTITVINDGPNAAYAVAVIDGLPENKTYVSDTAPYGCAEQGAPAPPNSYACPITDPMNPMDSLAAGAVVQFDIVAHIELVDAGKLNDNTVIVQSINPQTYMPVTTDPNVPPPGVILDTAHFEACLYARLADPDPVDPDPAVCDNVWVDQVQVAPANINLTKSADRDPAIYSEGENITWTVEAASTGPSPASDVLLTDTVGANQSIVSAVADVACTEAGGVPDVTGQVATCTLANPLASGATATMTVVTLVTGSVDNECVNDAAVEWADPLTDSANATAICLPPTTRMEKDLDEDSTTIVDLTNLFLEVDPTSGDLMCLTIYELVTNADNDPDGIGAYEFQLKFDHKIFDIEIEDTSWLSNGDTRDVTCAMSILTENWILFGCVSSDPTPGDGNIPPGQTADGTAAVITVCPEPDLAYRLTPGNDNGIFRMLLDENCELADILGHPLEAADWCCDGLDNDGDTVIDEFGEGLAPGVGPGGMLDTCSDMAVTVRILEGDLNLDCVVDVLDQQAIAFRYGMVFGLNLYDPWYDLEPNVKDFDIDIKDLQKVFGRDGSTCLDPIPPQDPLGPPPW